MSPTKPLLLALAASLAACAPDEARPPRADTDNTERTSQVESLGDSGPSQDAPSQAPRLRSLDTPLAVGAAAPLFDGYRERTRTVLVFIRGAW